MSIVLPPNKFVGLHAHTAASVFDGLGLPEDHIKFVLENGMDAWALTEHGHCNSFATAYLHAEQIRKKGGNFKFIAGCEMYLHPSLDEWRVDYENRHEARDAARELREQQQLVTPLLAETDEDDETVSLETTNALTIEREEESKSTKYFDPVNRRHHIVVIPKTSVGLQRLFHLVSRGYSEGFYRFPRIDYKMLREAASGGHLIVLTACIGGTMAYAALNAVQRVKFENISHALLDDELLSATVQRQMAETYEKLEWAVGRDSVFLEMQFNRLPAQCSVNRAMLKFAREHSLTQQLVVAADSHYPRPELWRDREIYKKLGWLKYTDINAASLPTDASQLKAELYPKNAAQVWAAFQEARAGKDFYDDAEIRDAIERSYSIAHELVGDVKPDRAMKLPTALIVPEGQTADQRLRALCEEGLAERDRSSDAEYVTRLERELGVISEKRFAEYFLTLREIIAVAQESMFVGPGRGSGAGSLVCYLLKITDVDPIKYDLLFERFLNIYREEPPDVDCVHQDHLVVMADGSLKRAIDIKPLDVALGGDGEPHQIIAAYSRRSRVGERPVRLLVRSSDGVFGSVVTVPNHKFLRSDGSVVRASSVDVGDTLMSAAGVTVVASERLPEPSEALFVDVTVADDHRFHIVPFDVLESADGQLQHVEGYL